MIALFDVNKFVICICTSIYTSSFVQYLLALFQNPNLLTAVICLIMELDYEGLVQVENTIRRRKDEMSDEYRSP